MRRRGDMTFIWIDTILLDSFGGPLRLTWTWCTDRARRCDDHEYAKYGIRVSHSFCDNANMQQMNRFVLLYNGRWVDNISSTVGHPIPYQDTLSMYYNLPLKGPSLGLRGLSLGLKGPLLGMRRPSGSDRTLFVFFVFNQVYRQHILTHGLPCVNGFNARCGWIGARVR